MNKIEVSDRVVMINLSGILTEKSFNGIKDLIEGLLTLGKKYFILDMRKTTHVHYGIGKLIDGLKETLYLYSGEMRVVCDDPYLLEIMRFATGDPYPSVYPSVREARRTLLI